jgi:Uma2 family endonuclease
MSVLIRPLTYEELDQFPNDGKRREIIGGVLHVAAAPLIVHQRILRRLTILFDAAVEATQAGEVLFAPVDVRFGRHDQVQPDLIFIRAERSHIYQENAVLGAPDVIVEILSPSTRAYDEQEKAELYARNGVPEYWIVDAITPALRPQRLVDGVYVPIEPQADGTFRSIVIPNLVVDPVKLFAGFDQ